MPARDLIHELISWFIDDVVYDLGSRKEIDFAYEIMEHGTSSDRRLSTWEKSRDMTAVFKQLIKETNDLDS